MNNLSRKDKQLLVDFEGYVKDIRTQLGDQVKQIDSRTEHKIALLGDVQEFFKRRAELEIEHAKNLDRLADRFQDRFQRQRGNYGVPRKDRAMAVQLWSKLLTDTKFKAKSCAHLGDIFNKNVAVRLGDIAEDVQRISKSVRETHLTLQEELMKAISHLQHTLRDYFIRHSNAIFAESKFRTSELAKQKAEDSPNKRVNEKKIKSMDKVKEKNYQRYVDCQLKSDMARNRYLLDIESAYAAFHKYNSQDVGDIISSHDHNFHASFKFALQAYCGSEVLVATSYQQCANTLAHAVALQNPSSDRDKFLEDNHGLFMIPIKFSFVPHAEDSIQQITTKHPSVQQELITEHHNLHFKVKQLGSELNEVQLLLNERNKALTDIYNQCNSDVNAIHHVESLQHGVTSSSPAHSPSSSGGISSQLKANKEELENSLLVKFREFILSQNLNIQTQAQFEKLQKIVGELSSSSMKPGGVSGRTASTSSSTGKEVRKPIKLFGTCLEEHIKETGQAIPDIIESCVKFITKFGLSHQGIFRLSGASQEISDMKKSFEAGRDPLAGLNHWKDINAVAGVFRAYFRELKEPLFPAQLFQDYIKTSKLNTTEEQIMECRAIMDKIAPWNLLICKYMLKFLNLVASYCEKNKMNAHNLAVVFGPTLIHVPQNMDILTSQGQINIFMEVLINEFYSIFPNEAPDSGLVGLTVEDGPEATEDSSELPEDDTGDQTEDELGSDDDMDGDMLEAEALYNYTARTHKELSFNKGDIIVVFSKTNDDWWDAQLNGSNGFVPASYVKLIGSDGSSDGSRSARDPTGPPDGADRMPPSLPEINTEEIVPSTGEETNVFASIDPTVAPSGKDPRRAQSDKEGLRRGGGIRVPPSRTGRPESAIIPGSQRPAPPYRRESQEQDLGASRDGPPKMSTFTRGMKLPLSEKDIKDTHGKLKGTPGTTPVATPGGASDESADSTPSDGPPSTFGHGSIKDRSRLFGSSLQRNQGGFQMMSDSPENHSPDLSLSSRFMPKGPPVPAVKPKPKSKKDTPPELVATINAVNAAAAAKAGNGNQDSSL